MVGFRGQYDPVLPRRLIDDDYGQPGLGVGWGQDTGGVDAVRGEVGLQLRAVSVLAYGAEHPDLSCSCWVRSSSGVRGRGGFGPG